MRALEMVEPGRDHRSTAGAVISHDRVTGDRSAGDPPSGPLLAILDAGEAETDSGGAASSDAEGALTGIPDDVAHQTYVIFRLTRWGLTKRWLSRSGVKNPKPADPISWWGPCVLNGNVEQTGLDSVRDVCPWNLDEARETDLCVNALPGHLSATVIEEYWRLGTRELKAHRLGVDQRTMRRRLSLAHTLLLELFNLAAADLPLECSYQGPGRPGKEEQ